MSMVTMFCMKVMLLKISSHRHGMSLGSLCGSPFQRDMSIGEHPQMSGQHPGRHRRRTPSESAMRFCTAAIPWIAGVKSAFALLLTRVTEHTAQCGVKGSDNFMKRTISGEVGKGSVSHNSRKFHAKNTDPERSHLNIDYCNENIKTVYHQMFDEALEKYNAKQTRADRRIDNYYEKIKNSKQEKVFHELILQIGNRDDMAAISEDGELAKQILDDLQRRNPQLRVFSAHLHMDEATPHLHIDFVPFTTGSKRGLETRVSLKQALDAQGFKGGTRSETEWVQWVQSEKEHLAAEMACYDIQWEHKDTHEKHLSVYDYEKKMRAAEVAELDEKLADKNDEFDTLTRRIEELDDGEKGITEMQNLLATDPEYQLPEPQGLMSAKSYKTKFVEPLIAKFKSLIKTVMVRYFQAKDDYHRLNQYNAKLYAENENLRNDNEYLSSKNNQLGEKVKDYVLLRKVFGNKQIDDLLEKAKATQSSKQRDTRFRNNNDER